MAVFLESSTNQIFHYPARRAGSQKTRLAPHSLNACTCSLSKLFPKQSSPSVSDEEHVSCKGILIKSSTHDFRAFPKCWEANPSQAVLVPTRRAGTLSSLCTSGVSLYRINYILTAQELPFPTRVALPPVSPTPPCISHHHCLSESTAGEATPSPQGSAVRGLTWLDPANMVPHTQ